MLVTGGRDGRLLFRSISDLQNKSTMDNAPMEVQSHSVLRGGVTAVCLSKIGQFVYAAGEDGSMFIYSLNKGERYPRSELQDGPEGSNELAKLETVNELKMEEIPFIVDMLQEEANRVNEEKKKQFKEELMNELDVIAKNLRKLLD
jgi:WD40 repeat protein